LIFNHFFSYSEELPSRCKKEIISAADFHHDGKITFDGLYHTIYNIGAADKVSKTELGSIFAELGDSSNAEKTIDIDDFMKLI
jgi:hypothetical protein